ncbi:MAG: hypothetical protein DI630_00455 [Gordonia sp. (in: high G+C Gram-positive bacteria)]|nr:MAG: hypothetical protein DI630_00455 [Gordonia sp. (in: high G+C Gram-positive bacteria)]
MFVPQYRYDDVTLSPPTPGRDLVMAVGLVSSRPGIGPKGGGQYVGVPLSVGSATTSLLRHDGVQMRLANSDLVLWRTPFDIAARRLGVHNLDERAGWEWLCWSLADHVTADYERLGPDPVTAAAGPEDTGPLVIVPCGARKLDHPAAAKDLYISSYQQLALRAAHALTASANIRILSGRHGLLDLDTVIEPYNQRLGDPGSVTASYVADQARATGLIEASEVVALAGKQYAAVVTATWPHARTPLAGSRGIGDQQHRLSAIATLGPAALTEQPAVTYLPA